MVLRRPGLHSKSAGIRRRSLFVLKNKTVCSSSSGPQRRQAIVTIRVICCVVSIFIAWIRRWLTRVWLNSDTLQFLKRNRRGKTGVNEKDSIGGGHAKFREIHEIREYRGILLTRGSV